MFMASRSGTTLESARFPYFANEKARLPFAGSRAGNGLMNEKAACKKSDADNLLRGLRETRNESRSPPLSDTNQYKRYY